MSTNRCDPRSSAGFGGVLPAAMNQRLATAVFRTTSLVVENPTSRFDSPGSGSKPNSSCDRGRREENIGPDTAERFGKIRRDAVVDERRRMSAARQHRDHPERRNAEQRLDFFRRLDPVVEVLEEEREADPETRAAEEAKQHVQCPSRTHGGVRLVRRVDDANVARLELSGDACFLRALQEA